MISISELKNCPFCGGSNIRYSTKTFGTGRKSQYHASYYCNSCHCYGARVLSNKVDRDDYDGRREMETSERLRKAAEEAWNKRG